MLDAELPRGETGGEVAERSDLLAGEAGGAHLIITEREHRFGRGKLISERVPGRACTAHGGVEAMATPEEFQESPIDGPGGAAAQLLIDDGTAKRAEWVFAIGPQREFANASDDPGHDGIGQAEVCKCCLGIDVGTHDRFKLERLRRGSHSRPRARFSAGVTASIQTAADRPKK